MSRTVVVVVDTLAIAQEPASWPAPGSSVVVAPGDDVTSAARAAPADTTHLVVLAARRDARHAQLVGNVAAGARPSLFVAVRTHDATPLALAAVASAALDIADDPATVVATLEARLASAQWGAWLPKVAKLDRPSPSLAQHLRSVVPGGAGFVARMAGDATIVAADRAEALAQGDQVFLIGAAPDTPEHDRLAALSGSGSVVTVPPITDTKKRYGAVGAEFVTMKESHAVQRSVVTCPICVLPVHGTACVFCHVLPDAGEAA